MSHAHPPGIDRAFQQVDVFTSVPYRGNPVAVVLDGQGLADETLQRFARWTNLSETTFVLPPTPAGRAQGADYRVRIFTPGGELPFAGHPTLGTCHAWLRAGGQPGAADRIVQECGVGPVVIRRHGAHLAFAAPPLRRSAPAPAPLARVAEALGLRAPQIRAAQLLDNGPVWLGLLLTDADAVLALEPDHAALRALGLKVGVIGAHAEAGAIGLIGRASREARAFADHADDASVPSPDFEVRAFAAPLGIPEDPVTGSLNASLAQWLMDDGLAPPTYIAAQGQCLDRAGRVRLSRDAQGQVWVGGDTVTCIDGTVRL